MTERTYTQADMARARDDGHGVGYSDGQYALSTGYPSGTPNPYEQEEA